MSPRPAFLALPRLSLTTVLFNLPSIFNRTNGAPPLILMDRYDYDRLRAEVLAGPAENQKAPYLIMAYDELRRRGLLRLIDYTEFYEPSMQHHYLTQSQALLQNTSERTNRETAVQASLCWIEYTRGGYQEQFRAGLGESTRSFRTLRRSERTQRQKLKRGVSDPRAWNEKLLSRGIAALAVRDQANTELEVNVQGIITGTQYQIIGDFIESESDHTTTSDTADLSDLQAGYRFLGIDVETATDTRNILDEISTITTELSGVQYDDWFLLGPSLAVPQYDDFFDLELITDQLEKLDQETLVAETKQAIEYLERVPPKPGTLQYEADWLGEKYDLLPTDKTRQTGLFHAVEFAYNTTNYSRELWTVLEETDISQAAALVGTSIVGGQQRASDDEEIYRQGMKLMTYFDSPSIGTEEITAVRKERRGDSWDEHTDWFETANRGQRYT